LAASMAAMKVVRSVAMMAVCLVARKVGLSVYAKAVHSAVCSVVSRAER